MYIHIGIYIYIYISLSLSLSVSLDRERERGFEFRFRSWEYDGSRCLELGFVNACRGGFRILEFGVWGFKAQGCYY